MPNRLPIPSSDSGQWGTILNNFLTQSLDNTNGGGINKFDTFSQRPTTLGADDKGKTYLYTQTGNFHQWTGTEWKVLNESVINVKDYGAVGDGVSDDTVALQVAIQVARDFRNLVLNSLSGGSASVYLPFGKFRVVNTIELPYDSQITLEGFSKFGSTLLCDHDEDGVLLYINTNLKNLSIQRKDRQNGYKKSAVIFGALGYTTNLGGAYQEINNVYAVDYWDYGFYVNAVSAKFYNSMVIGCNNGFYVAGGNNTFYSCYAEVCVKKALDVPGIGNHFYDFYTERCNINNDENYAIHIRAARNSFYELTYDPNNSGDKPNIVIESPVCTLKGLIKTVSSTDPNKVDILLGQYASSCVLDGEGAVSGGSYRLLPSKVSQQVKIISTQVQGGIMTDKYDGYHKIIGTVILPKGRIVKGWQNMFELPPFPTLYAETNTSFSELYTGSNLNVWGMKIDLSDLAKVYFGFESPDYSNDKILSLDGTKYSSSTHSDTGPLFTVNPQSGNQFIRGIITHDVESTVNTVAITYEIIYTFS